jgi:hypothetical protein
MSMAIKDMTTDELRELIATTVRESMEEIMEDLRALNSPEFIQSIEESRRDYERGDVRPLEEALDA